MCRGSHSHEYRSQTLPKQELVQPFQAQHQQAGSVTSFDDLRPIDGRCQVLLSRSCQNIVHHLMATKSSQRSLMAVRIAQKIISLGAVIDRDDIAAIK